MNLNELDFLMEIYGQEQYPFYYYRNKYALQLLANCIGETGMTVPEIKQSPWAFLLDKPLVKNIMASLKGNRICKTDLQDNPAADVFYFDLTFSKWGVFDRHRNEDWFQTTRPGQSLVVQLNFGAEHDRDYYKLVKPDKTHPFRWLCHPVAENNKLTMAWARIDIDWETGEALIEEIQNDWLRNVKDIKKTLARMVERKHKNIDRHYLFQSTGSSMESFQQYSDKVIAPYQKIWQEAMLSASIHFIRKELGLKTIYYHTHEGGKLLKNCTPPRSVYYNLPRKFGFKPTTIGPRFIRNCHYLKKKLKTNSIKWFRLRLK